MKRFGYTPSYLFGVQEVDTDFGLEVEIEGFNLPNQLDHYFDVHQDGSLRAPQDGQALEYVFKKPYKRVWAEKAVLYLDRKLRENGAQLNWSYRTSVHVHLNASNMTFTQIYTWLCVYYILEDLLTEYCGKTRQGNLFCLRAKDAEWIIDTLRSAATHDSPRDLANENMRYAACNIVALSKFGTLEFRSMRGTSDPAVILPWMSTLLKIKEFSRKFANPSEVIGAFSSMGSERFLRESVDPNVLHLFLGMQDVENRMYEGARLAQDVAYAVREWPTKKEVPQKMKPGELGPVAVGRVNFDQLVQPAEWMNEAAQLEHLVRNGRVHENPLVRGFNREGAPRRQPQPEGQPFNHDDEEI